MKTIILANRFIDQIVYTVLPHYYIPPHPLYKPPLLFRANSLHWVIWSLIHDSRSPPPWSMEYISFTHVPKPASMFTFGLFSFKFVFVVQLVTIIYNRLVYNSMGEGGIYTCEDVSINLDYNLHFSSK